MRINVYSPRSPLGAAINGKRVGETARFWLPNGRASTVEILEAVPYAGSKDDGPMATATAP
jgi:transcription elongation factor GreA